MKKEEIDFNGINLNHWSWEGKITPDVIHGFLQYLSDLMQWLNSEGRALLEREGPLTFEEYNLLVDKAFNLWFQMSTDRAFCLLFMAVIKKGIFSLQQAVEADATDGNDKNDEQCREAHRQWFQSILYQLGPGARFGIGSRSCRIEESRALIESTIPIVRCLKADHLLREIAQYRFPKDPEAQELFFASRKDW
ncbi:MAG: hypothetical protein PHC70_03095 [Patescibacteria group bacterium]|nr:hypothetical protein [Patescibacteria group bacterium]